MRMTDEDEDDRRILILMVWDDAHIQ